MNLHNLLLLERKKVPFPSFFVFPQFCLFLIFCFFTFFISKSNENTNCIEDFFAHIVRVFFIFRKDVVFEIININTKKKINFLSYQTPIRKSLFDSNQLYNTKSYIFFQTSATPHHLLWETPTNSSQPDNQLKHYSRLYKPLSSV